MLVFVLVFGHERVSVEQFRAGRQRIIAGHRITAKQIHIITLEKGFAVCLAIEYIPFPFDGQGAAFQPGQRLNQDSLVSIVGIVGALPRVTRVRFLYHGGCFQQRTQIGVAPILPGTVHSAGSPCVGRLLVAFQAKKPHRLYMQKRGAVAQVGIRLGRQPVQKRRRLRGREFRILQKFQIAIPGGFKRPVHAQKFVDHSYLRTRFAPAGKPLTANGE